MALQLAMAKDPEAAFFKKLEGLQPCEVSELKPGTHIFAVYGLNSFNAAYLPLFFFGFCPFPYRLILNFYSYCIGDNFFKTASYTIEAVCAKSYEDTTNKLKEIEAQILRKRTDLRQFETEYRKVVLPSWGNFLFLFGSAYLILYFSADVLQALARFQEVTNRYSQEKQSVSSVYSDLLSDRIFW